MKLCSKNSMAGFQQHSHTGWVWGSDLGSHCMHVERLNTEVFPLMRREGASIEIQKLCSCSVEHSYPLPVSLAILQ